MTQSLNFTFSTKRTSELKNYRNIHTKINKQQTSKYVIEKNENGRQQNVRIFKKWNFVKGSNN